MIAAFSVVSCIAISPATAAPVSFHFDATISQIEGDPSTLNLPFSFAVGQPLSAIYSFSDVQTLLNIFNNTSFISHGDIAFAIGGTQGTATTNFGMLNDSAIPSMPGQPNSSVEFGYLSLTDVFPGWNGTIANHPASIDLTFIGNEGVVSSVTDILNQGTWDQLIKYRKLTVQLGYFGQSEFRTVTVLADVTQATVVPEPSGASLLILMLAGRVRRGRRR
jgi:hypothetical protein